LLPTAELIINTAPARLVQMFQQRYKNSHRILCKLSGTGEKSNLKTVSNLEILQEVVKKPQHPDTGLNKNGESIDKPEVFHPRPDSKGKPVKIDNPTPPEPMSAFEDPSQYAVMLPVTDMVGGGSFRLKPGQWTDDTSMALCLATSLLESQGFDADDQMQRYCRWQEEGYLSSSGRCFDIGNTVSSALRSYKTHGNSYAGSTEAWSAGNGSLMRLAPIPLFYYPDIEQAVAFAAESSRTTHGADEYIDACRLYIVVNCWLRWPVRIKRICCLLIACPLVEQPRSPLLPMVITALKANTTFAAPVMWLTAWKRHYGVSEQPTRSAMAFSRQPIWAMMPIPWRPSVGKLLVRIMAAMESLMPGKRSW